MNNLKNLRGTVDLLPDQLIKWQNVEKIISDLFKTKEEAEKAASKYGCIGAHQMGNYWMPCSINKHSH